MPRRAHHGPKDARLLRLALPALVLVTLVPAACGERGAERITDPAEVSRRAHALAGRRDGGATDASTTGGEAEPFEASPRDREREAILSGGPAGRLEGTVRDEDTRRPLPCRAWITDGGGTEAGAVLGGVGFWCEGRFSTPIIPGSVRLEVSAGRRRSVSSRQSVVEAGRRRRVEIGLRRPGPLAFEERGWYGTDLFRPVSGGGEALLEKGSLELLALAARAEGLAFCGAAPPWGAGVPTGSATAGGRDVRGECDRLSDAGFALSPAWRGADAPFYGGLFFIDARDPRALAPSGWDLQWPNFIAIERARREGATAVLRGITGGREMDPHSEIVPLRPGLETLYRNAPVALGGTACELPFDLAAGVPPDAVALSGSAEDEAVWFRLLSMGHRMPSVHVAAGSFSGGVVPAERTFVRLGRGAVPTAKAVAEAVRSGRTMCSTGPFVFLEVDGRGPGEVFAADGTSRKIVFEAHSSTERDSEITVLELLRNGEVIRSERGQGRSFIAARTDVRERETAWYIARARAGPGGERVAWTSPVYFEGPGYAPPRPVETLVRGSVREAGTGRALGAAITAHLFGRETASAKSDPVTGAYTIKCSPGALIRAVAPGHLRAEARVFFHTDAPREVFAIHTNASGRGAGVLADESTYERMRLACAEAKIDLRVEPVGSAP